MNIMKYRSLFFGISLLVLIPSIISLIAFGFNPSIDFVGGSQFDIAFPAAVDQGVIASVANAIYVQYIVDC